MSCGCANFGGGGCASVIGSRRARGRGGKVVVLGGGKLGGRSGGDSGKETQVCRGGLGGVVSQGKRGGKVRIEGVGVRGRVGGGAGGEERHGLPGRTVWGGGA